MRAPSSLFGKTAQRGAAMMVMLVILVMGSLAFLVSSLSTSAQKTARQEITATALALAKEALLGLSTKYTDYPGSLPCPDTDDDGESDAAGGTECPQYIGRLPWKTLGLSSDLRDADGERLWYTLSRNVRRYASVLPLNSNKTGTLNITGTYTDSNLVAIIFAPGSSVGTQSRSSTQTAYCSTTTDTREQSFCAANYLEGSNANPSPGASPNQNYQNANSSVPFNDQLIAISYGQLFSLIERRVGNEVKKLLNNYYNAWNAFPYAASFGDPALSTFTGVIGVKAGLLPVHNTTAATTLAWITSPVPHYYIDGVDQGACYFSDGAIPNSRLRCISTNITINAGKIITFTGKLDDTGIGLGFYDTGLWYWRPHDITTTTEVRVKNSLGATVLASDILDNVTVTGSLNSDGSANITFSATGKTGGSAIQRIDLRDIKKSSTTSFPSWFIDNNWHHLIYYEVSSGYAPGGDHTCTNPCLTVNGQSGGSNKQAIVLMTGAALADQSRAASPNALCLATGATIAPNACQSNYLEDENEIPPPPLPPDFTYENKNRSDTFNDQVIIVEP